MGILDGIFKRRKNTGDVARGRLLEVLTNERTLPVPLRVATVSLKQTYDGLSINFGEGNWPDLVDELTMQLESPAMRDLFDGAQVRLDLGDRKLSPAELEELSLLLARHRMVLNTRRSDKDGASSAPRSVPLIPPEALHTEVAYMSTPDSVPEPLEWVGGLSGQRDPTLLLRHPVLAGQVIHYGGTIIIAGDVSPAAQVIADRDIFVLGKLRGIAHAGASGNEDAIIAALFFQPTQARIAGMIAQMPSGQYVHAWPAEMARIRAGRIVIEPWSAP